jgi:RNA polymerase sigma-70 factor (ECF subfamily)
MWPEPDHNQDDSIGRRRDDAGEATFDKLFATYFSPLRRYVYRYLQAWEEAEDVVHDIFVQLWARRDAIETITDIDAYLYTAARNRALARLKHHAHEERWRISEAARASSGDPPIGPERDLRRAEIAAALQRALDSVSPRQRQVLLLHWRGHTYDEIGAELGISGKTASVHATRAFEALRALLASLME